MAYEYSPINISLLNVGDKVLLRNGTLETVKEVTYDRDKNPDGWDIGVLTYNADGRAPSYTPGKFKDKDVIALISPPSEINLNSYKFEVGQYVLRSDNRVVRVTEVDPNDPLAPIRISSGDARTSAWYKPDGRPLTRTDLPRIIQVFAPLKDQQQKQQGQLDISNLKPGDRVRLRNGDVKVVAQNDGTRIPIRLEDGYWYYANGRQGGVERTTDIVEILSPVESQRTDTGFYKQLLLDLLAVSEPTKLVTVKTSAIRDIVGQAHDGVEANKVSTAFLGLLDAFASAKDTIQIPAKYLKQLIEL